MIEELIYRERRRDYAEAMREGEHATLDTTTEVHRVKMGKGG